MIQSSPHNNMINIRIANFSAMNFSFENMLAFDSRNQNIAYIVKEMRTYADLPYIFLFSHEQTPFIVKLLSALKAIRSPCYPYALFCIGSDGRKPEDLNAEALDLDIFIMETQNPDAVLQELKAYATSKFVVDQQKLQINNRNPLPEKVDVLIVGAGVTGLYAGLKLLENNISFCILEQRDMVGGIWSLYANDTSEVNTSEGAYRLLENDIRSNRDHSTTREILDDIACISDRLFDHLYLNTKVAWIQKVDGTYHADITRDGQKSRMQSAGVILAINDRVGTPRTIEWEGQAQYQGKIFAGISNEANDFDWRGKNVVLVGMGAFAVENARTALEGGARHVTVVCRRHGTVCPKIIDYLNFSTPYTEDYHHDRKSNMKNMLLWKKLYDLSGATQPECWMGKIKHDGETISVSDIWFIGHFLKKIETVSGTITELYDNGVIVNDHIRIEADIIIPCIGFERNALHVKDVCDYTETFNNNYLDRDFMYLADAYIDDDVFNSFFGSSVLEMVKFFLDVYIYFFNKPAFEDMLLSEGIKKVSIEDRKWSDYISGAMALIKNYPDIHEMAHRQVAQRTRNFNEMYDVETYIASNKREWIDTHSFLAGKPMKEDDCLPYVFQKLIG